MHRFTSNPEHCSVFPDTGWTPIDDEWEVTDFPIYDLESGLFARLGHGPAGEWLRSQGLEWLTPDDYKSLHRKSIFVEPLPMPTIAMLKSSGVPLRNKDIDRFRNSNMMSRQWCAMHDMEMFVRLAKAGWTIGDSVSNFGKHYCAPEGTIFGWFLAPNAENVIQNPSTFHKSVPTYVDYATTFHAKRRRKKAKSDETPVEPSVAAPVVVVPWLDPGQPPRIRRLAWAMKHIGHREDPPGSNTSPLIDKWAEYAVRDVDKDGDEDSMGGLWNERKGAHWCAVFVGASMVETRLPGDPSLPHSRVSGFEYEQDAKDAGRWLEPEDVLKDRSILKPGDIIIWPRTGAPNHPWWRHVSLAIGWKNDFEVYEVGGNVSDAVKRGHRDIREAHGIIHTPEHATHQPEPVVESRLVEGVDVAKWQSPELMDYNQLAERFDFLIARACYGITKDPTWKRHIERADKAGMLVGGYMWYRQDEPWKKQLEVFLEQMDRLNIGTGDIVPAVDLEVPLKKYGPLLPERYNTDARQMCAELADAYGGCMVYTNPNTIALMGSPTWLNDYPLWIAHQTDASEPDARADWSIWQYAAEPVQGFSGPKMDVNRARKVPLIK